MIYNVTVHLHIVSVALCILTHTIQRSCDNTLTKQIFVGIHHHFRKFREYGGREREGGSQQDGRRQGLGKQGSVLAGGGAGFSGARGRRWQPPGSRRCTDDRLIQMIANNLLQGKTNMHFRKLICRNACFILQLQFC